MRKENSSIPHHWTDSMIKKIPRIGGLCLDLGCRDDKDKKLFEKLGYEWIGSDINFNPRISVLNDAHNLPFIDNTFAIVSNIALLEHLSDPWKSFKEINRVLIRGGYVFIKSAFLEPCHGKNYVSYYHMTWKGLEELLKGCGFEILFIAADKNVLEMIAKYFMPIRLLQTIFRHVGRLYANIFFTYGKKSKSAKEFYLDYASSYYSLAKKQ